MSRRLFGGMFCFGVMIGCLTSWATAAESVAKGLFARKRLVAWCIVPFDAKKRGPEERAAMLEKLGFTRFAYDYRAEHTPTFDAEIEALKRHKIELTAWWFPATLNDEAKMTLELFARHKVTPQLWVTGGGGPAKDAADQQARVVAEAARIRPIAEAAAKVGCKVGLYNHGGWFGEPENQVAVIRELSLDNVGLVYNLHHGHDHLDRFPELLRMMKPYLYALNLNGMVKNGDRQGQKILQLGEGDLDLQLLKIIRDSGFTGPFGILGHTQDDAEERLRDNLDGLDWLVPQVDGLPPGPKPKMRTPVPRPAAASRPPVSNKPLQEGRFGQALDGRAGGAFVAGRDEFRRFPVTVECWTRLADKSPYNILVAHELKSSGTHWEIFSMAGTGHLTAYLPGFAPDHCRSEAMICDSQWHHVAMVLEMDRVRLYVDGRQVADQPHKRTDRPAVPGGLALASLVDRVLGCTGLVDDVRISQGIRPISSVPDKPLVADDSTVALWHLDELVETKRFEDASSRKNAAVLGDAGAAAPAPAGVRTGKIEGHWGEDAIGFRWTESDSRDDRLGKMDSGPFYSGSITGAGGPVYKGIVVRLGDRREASVCYDTELLRVAAGWTGYLKFDPARFGVIVPPGIDGDVAFATPRFPGVSLQPEFANFREAHPYGPLPADIAHYEGLYRHGQRVVLKYTVGPPERPPGLQCEILESPWLETVQGVSAFTRTFRIGPSKVPLRILAGAAPARMWLHPRSESATLDQQPGIGNVLVIAPRDRPVAIKLLVVSAGVNEAAMKHLIAASPAPEDLLRLTRPGPTLWGEPLITRGELAAAGTNPSAREPAPYVVDTISLPFDNPFRALLFCGGHDFLPDRRAAVCTLHGDVWLVGGIDDTLERITWRRFATGLFQPLGLKVANGQIYVVGRDQITRLHDLNGDGEADFYENFNNDAHVTLNGHEYVTCLETDRAGNFYYVKGNCNSQTPHDGSLLRVSPDGSGLDVFATGFRNSNGIGMGPGDEITVAPQEGEWTPASGVFLVRQGGFYGGMMSHHRPTPPTDFERPLVWFPRLADNSSGGQVWTTSDRWGPLSNQLLHLSYGQCRLRLVLRDGGHSGQPAPNNGVSIELPLRFYSGIHRGRMNPHDSQLYVTGLKGWTTSAVHDGCFQRVRYTGGPVDMPVGLATWKNGVALTFDGELDRASAEDLVNYQLEAWNYKWSAAYGSPEYRPSAPGQVGRDELNPRSATLMQDKRTVFLELPELKPVDQLSIGYTLFSSDGRAIEQTAVLTLNTLSSQVYPESELHRPTEDPERARFLASLRPGIRIDAGSQSNRVQRMFAWDLIRHNGTAVDGKSAITASGWVRIPFTGRYRFTSVASPSTISLSIGSTPPTELLPEGLELPLNRGVHPITVVQSAGRGDVQFRLMWESPRFPREAIPPSQLLHEPLHGTSSARLQSGAMLFHKLRCANCHLDSASGVFDVPRAAPRLDGIGSRLESAWLSRWIREPHRMRNDSAMPGLVAPDDASTASDIAAYLSTLRKPDPNEKAFGQSAATGSELQAAAGAELYERLGCIACHTLAVPDQHDEWNRVSLHFVNAKFRPGAMARYLRTPLGHDPHSRMPDFQLADAEAAALAAFLGREARGRLDGTGGDTAGDPDRGRRAFARLRCAHCHAVEEPGELAKSSVASLRKPDGADGGCLATATDAEPGIPRFQLAAADRLALLEYRQSLSADPGGDAGHLVPTVDAWMEHLRCNSCHARDARPSLWPEIIAEEGSGRPAESVPQLTWIGEKLQGPWIEKLLKGEIKSRPRPWLVARMPAFPAYASVIAHGMAAEHGVPFEERAPGPFDSADVETGRRLTLRDGGLDCRQCHGVGKEQPRGDAATQIALGINFAMTRDRMRPEFALRQMLDPPRYDIGSRMPRFAPDLRTTAARQIAGGEAARQFELLKQYLWSVKVE